MDGCYERQHAAQRSMLIERSLATPITMEAVHEENNTQNNEYDIFHTGNEDGTTVI
jgi:hypothetical protein